MKTRITMAERVACMIIGTALSIVALVMIALGLTFLPVIGIFVALPILGLAFYCFRPGKWEIAAEREEEPVTEDTWVEESMAA